MDDQQIIDDLLDKVRNDVINSMQSTGRYATGDTIANLTIATGPGYGALYAPFWVDALEVGRKPTSPTGPYQLSDPSFIDRIKAWCDAKGIAQGFAWAIKKNIDKKGYPGKPGVLTTPLEQADKHINDAAEQIAMNMQKEVLDLLKVFD